MTLPNEQINTDSFVSCQCANKNCNDCKCGCSREFCCKKSSDTGASECPFIRAHPNWQKCPFMSKMFMTCKSMGHGVSDSGDVKTADHSTCDSAKCSQIPVTQCSSCHKTPAFNHTVTLEMDTETAADQTEETVL